MGEGVSHVFFKIDLNQQKKCGLTKKTICALQDTYTVIMTYWGSNNPQQHTFLYLPVEEVGKIWELSQKATLPYQLPNFSTQHLQ